MSPTAKETMHIAPCSVLLKIPCVRTHPFEIFRFRTITLSTISPPSVWITSNGQFSLNDLDHLPTDQHPITAQLDLKLADTLAYLPGP